MLWSAAHEHTVNVWEHATTAWRGKGMQELQHWLSCLPIIWLCQPALLLMSSASCNHASASWGRPGMQQAWWNTPAQWYQHGFPKQCECMLVQSLYYVSLAWQNGPWTPKHPTRQAHSVCWSQALAQRVLSPFLASWLSKLESDAAFCPVLKFV